MSDNNQYADRDEVLYAFHQECTRPTAEAISAWVNRYPQFADDIRTHAAIARDWDACEEDVSEVPDLMLKRAYSRALSILYAADLQNEAVDVSARQSFEQLMSAQNKAVPTLAREIGIKRGVLSDLVNGRVKPPIGKRLTQAVMRALSIPIATFESAVQLSLSSPRIGMAKANVTPTVTPRSYEDVIKSSGMTKEEIRYWLDES